MGRVTDRANIIPALFRLNSPGPVVFRAADSAGTVAFFFLAAIVPDTGVLFYGCHLVIPVPDGSLSIIQE